MRRKDHSGRVTEKLPAGSRGRNRSSVSYLGSNGLRRFGVTPAGHPAEKSGKIPAGINRSPPATYQAGGSAQGSARGTIASHSFKTGVSD